MNHSRVAPLAQNKTGQKSRRTTAYYQRADFAMALAESKIPMGARICFEELLRACGRRAFTWIEQGELARRLGCTVRTVQRYERALAKAGFVTLARVSLWARWKRGGSRRVAVPHAIVGDRLACPAGVLDEAEALLVGDGVVATAGQTIERRGGTTPLSCQGGLPSSSSKKRNSRSPKSGVLPTIRRLIGGTLCLDGAKPSVEDEWRRAYRLQCIAYAKGLGYA